MSDEAQVLENTPSVTDAPLVSDSGGEPQGAPASVASAASPAVADAPVSKVDAATTIVDAPTKTVSPTSLLGDAEGDKPASEADASAPVVEEAAAESAPAVEYQEFVLPEGFVVKDPAVFNEVTGIFKQHGVPQELAQGLIDKHLATVQREAAAAAESAVEKYKASAETQRVQDFDRRVNDGLEASKAAFGNRFDATVKTAASVLSNYGKEYAQAFRSKLDAAGLGTDPDVVGYLYKLGVALGEGKAVPASPQTPQAPVSRSAKRYA